MILPLSCFSRQGGSTIMLVIPKITILKKKMNFDLGSSKVKVTDLLK